MNGYVLYYAACWGEKEICGSGVLTGPTGQHVQSGSLTISKPPGLSLTMTGKYRRIE
jgi:hypothetical protein